MSRPRGDAEKKLLAAALALAREKSCGQVTVREVCRRAKVNLGLFHYHFKSRDALLARVLRETYQEFFTRLSGSADGAGTPPQRLRRALRAIARYARENRRLCAGMLRDGMNGDRQVIAFAAEAFPHHLPLVMTIYEEGARRGDFRRLPQPLLLAFFMGVVDAPVLMYGLIEQSGARRPFGRSLKTVQDELLSDAAIETRLDLILAALEKP
jgi:AcrR family transcriptional regulator